MGDDVGVHRDRSRMVLDPAVTQKVRGLIGGVGGDIPRNKRGRVAMAGKQRGPGDIAGPGRVCRVPAGPPVCEGLRASGRSG